MKVLHAALLIAGLGMPLCAPNWAQDAGSVLELETAIGRALKSSPALAGAQASFSAAQGSERQARQFANPELSLDAENIAGSGAYGGTDAAEYTFSLTQPIELGKRAARRGVAGGERLAVSQNVLAVRLDLIRDVTTAYAAVLAEEEKLKLVEEREALARDVLANVSKRVGAARDPLIYKNQADVALATTVLERQKAQRDVQLAKHKLAALWGEAALTETLDTRILHDKAEPEALAVYQTRLGDNPDLKRFESLRQAREAALRLEKAQNIPDPALSVGVRRFSDSEEQAMVLGMSLPIPVFNRNHGNIARAGAEVVLIEQEERQAKLGAEQELLTAWQEWEAAAAESRELEKRIIPAAKEALTLSRQGYERGRFSFLEVLNAQRMLAEAQEQHINAGQRRINAKAAVERLTAITTPSIPQGDK